MRVAILFVVSFIIGCKASHCQQLQPETHRVLEIDLRQFATIQTHLNIITAVEYHNRHYCLFNFNQLRPIQNNKMKLLFSIDCKTLEYRLENYPDELELSLGVYDDLYVRHDTLFISTYGSWHKNDYFFDTIQRRWIETEKQSALIYEDDDYQVFTINHGEWGKFTWFSNKHNGNQYVMDDCGFVRRIDDTFFVVSRARISSVSTSQLAQSLTAPISYREAANKYMFYKDSAFLTNDSTPRFVNPIERFSLTDYNYFSRYEGDTLFIGSYIAGDTLFLLTKHFGNNVLMYLDGNKPTLIEKQLDSCDIVLYHNSIRGFLQTDRLLLPFIKDYANMGLLDFKGRQCNTLDIRIAVDTLRRLQTDPFIQTIKHLSDNWGRLKDSDLREYEESLGGSFIFSDPPSEEPRNGFFEDLGLRNCHVDWYFKTIDTLYTIETEYCIDNNTHLANAMFLDYMPPLNYRDRANHSSDRYELKNTQITALLKERLNALCGKAKTKKDRLCWHYGPLTIELYPRDNRILIYKK
jgi:hypothetical protein